MGRNDPDFDAWKKRGQLCAAHALLFSAARRRGIICTKGGRDMFLKKKRTPMPIEFDRENLRPVIRSSICTGERVAGFKDLRTGRFSEVMLVRSQADLDEFRFLYGIGARGHRNRILKVTKTAIRRVRLRQYLTNG